MMACALANNMSAVSARHQNRPYAGIYALANNMSVVSPPHQNRPYAGIYALTNNMSAVSVPLHKISLMLAYMP